MLRAMHQRILGILAALSLGLSCGGTGTATLDLSASARAVANNVATAQVRATATRTDGRIGTGTVQLTATAGTLAEPNLTLDAFGTARTTWTCDLATEVDCRSDVTVDGRWEVDGAAVTGSATVRATGGTGTGGGAGGGTGGGGADYSDAGCPALIMSGRTGVIPNSLNFDSSNRRFTLFNSAAFTSGMTDWRDFPPGRGVLVTVAEPNSPSPYNDPQTWFVYLFHTGPGQPAGSFALGLFRPAGGGGQGTGTRMRGPGTTCSGFEGDDFNVKSVELGPDGGVLHIAAEIWAHCPDPLNNLPDTRAHGYICY